MPILPVKVSARRTPELSSRINETLLELTSRVLGKRRDLTAVVVDETHTKTGKARCVAEAFAAILGDLHDESDVHVQDVRAAAYGFGGRTQAYRHQHPHQ